MLLRTAFALNIFAVALCGTVGVLDLTIWHRPEWALAQLFFCALNAGGAWMVRRTMRRLS